jgi:hypothetical protein
MIRVIRNQRTLAAFFAIVLILSTFSGLTANAGGRPFFGHHSRAKGALIGSGVGLLGGALLGEVEAR